jgi:flagellar biosynthesis/type III secretory pathway M-ring protein FliF/YscJ
MNTAIMIALSVLATSGLIYVLIWASRKRPDYGTYTDEEGTPLSPEDSDLINKYYTEMKQENPFTNESRKL